MASYEIEPHFYGFQKHPFYRVGQFSHVWLHALKNTINQIFQHAPSPFSAGDCFWVTFFSKNNFKCKISDGTSKTRGTWLFVTWTQRTMGPMSVWPQTWLESGKPSRSSWRHNVSFQQTIIIMTFKLWFIHEHYQLSIIGSIINLSVVCFI